MYVHQEYPKCLYALDGTTLIVKSYPEEVQRVGTGVWYASAKAANDARAAVPAPPLAAPPVAAAVVPDVPAAIDALVEAAEAKLKKFFTLPVKLIAEQVLQMESLEDLLDVRRIEEQRPGGARVTVLRAVLGRMESLQQPAPPQEGVDEIAQVLGVTELGK